MEKLIEYIKQNYNSTHGAKTEEWSQGNSSDVFNDGVDLGKAVTLKEIADLIGLEVEPLSEPE